jgi:glycosyltransferase involved in cell wall biosynthesis
MRLLYYNWVQFDDPEGRSGGVRQYQANLISHLAETTEHEIVMVSSGTEYDRLDPRMRFERTRPRRDDGVESFVFVNSPVMAPGHNAFGSEEIFDESSLEMWHEFLREQGPFDVVHFDSLEGIPISWVRVHEAQPLAKVVLYTHNYYSICPQVNLWKDEEVACVDYREGKDCVTCLPEPVDQGEALRAYQMSHLLRRLGVRPGSRVYRAAYAIYEATKILGISGGIVRAVLRLARGMTTVRSSVRSAFQRVIRLARGPAIEPASPAPAPRTESITPVAVSLKKAPSFRQRRERATELINREVDTVLATSFRTAEVLESYGIDRARTEVCYIGTRAADEQFRSNPRTSLHTPGELSIAYLGYMRRDKGFKALIDTLATAPAELKNRLRLVVAARRANDELFEALEALAQDLGDVVHYDGYTHDALGDILETVDIGIVPVQWEDNLPQVATEMVAHGLPILTSDRGGAQELGGSNRDFIFEASNPKTLIDRLQSIADGDTPLGGYWERAEQLQTMEMHSKRLLEIYRQPSAA